MDGVLAEAFIDDIRVAARIVAAQVRALAVTPDLDIEDEADRDLLAAGPGGDVDWLPRQAGDPVRRLIGEGRCRHQPEA